jgi:hypothetical protein
LSDSKEIISKAHLGKFTIPGIWKLQVDPETMLGTRLAWRPIMMSFHNLEGHEEEKKGYRNTGFFW